MKYFVKNRKIHKRPVPKRCKVHYTGQRLRDTPPRGYEKCDHCFRTGRG